jgi:hypothetical protein
MLPRSLRSARGLAATVLVLCTAFVLALVASSPAAEASQAKKVNKYIGAQKCKTCHSSPETGNQFEALSKMKHSKAFATLASDEAKKVAAERKIEDPQKADACLKCHETGFGVPDAELAKGFDKTAGIQCESCHGPGDAHMKARLAAAASEPEGSKHEYKGVPEGEIIHNPPMATCTGCHNKDSPSYKGFCFCKAKKEIRHLNPLRVRTDADKAALQACSCEAGCECTKTCCKEGKCSELAVK